MQFPGCQLVVLTSKLSQAGNDELGDASPFGNTPNAPADHSHTVNELRAKVKEHLRAIADLQVTASNQKLNGLGVQNDLMESPGPVSLDATNAVLENGNIEMNQLLRVLNDEKITDNCTDEAYEEYKTKHTNDFEKATVFGTSAFAIKLSSLSSVPTMKFSAISGRLPGRNRDGFGAGAVLDFLAAGDATSINRFQLSAICWQDYINSHNPKSPFMLRMEN